ncbi:MAG: hypothetical protein JNK85_23395 [Verrucomicrobiales bacterium]|nr:hypothetical protein [Verrucomicrobiales bacterium]
MNKAIGVQLLGFGAASIGLGCLVYFLARPLALPTLIAGLAGGTLCLVAGIRAVLGVTRKTLPLLSLIPLTIVLVSQAVMTWGAGTPEIPARRSASLVVCLLLALSYLMLMRVAYAGSSYVGNASRPANGGGKTTPPASASAVKEAAGKP